VFNNYLEFLCLKNFEKILNLFLKKQKTLIKNFEFSRGQQYCPLLSFALDAVHVNAKCYIRM